MSVLFALLLAVPASALDMESARLNFDTVARNYVAARSSADDVWTLKRKTGAPLRLRFDKTEAGTVHPVAGGRLRGLADFKTVDGKSHYVAELVVATGGDLWDVKSLRWLGKQETCDLRAQFARSARAAADRKPAPRGSLPDISLADASGKETFIPECPKPRCLTVYVTPWCPYCRNATALLQGLQSHLAAKGVPMRVVVGADEEGKVRDYAKAYGEGALLDPGGRWSVNGVPHFFVSDEAGGVYGDEAGVRPGLPPAGYAAALGLP